MVRPYDSEDEYLDAEVDTLSRGGVILLGAPSKPEGVILRFEVLLRGGEPLLRGEGRVVRYMPKVLAGEGGLVLRFQRIDVRTKGLIDRALAHRAQRDAAKVPSKEPVSKRDTDRSPPSERTLVTAATAARVVKSPSESTLVSAPEALPPPPPPSERTLLGVAPPPPRTMPPPASPVDRDARLDRLRHRALGLTPEAVEELLRARRKG